MIQARTGASFDSSDWDILNLPQPPKSQPRVGHFPQPPLYTTAATPILVVVLDESHDVKKPRSKLNIALSYLQCERILMLTGTPIHNTFTDRIGKTMLLPGGGFFTSSDHFHHLFCDQKNSEPQGYKRQLYCRFHQGLIVARPKRVVNLCAKGRVRLWIHFNTEIVDSSDCFQSQEGQVYRYGGLLQRHGIASPGTRWS